jgi:hypothetical protein
MQQLSPEAFAQPADEFFEFGLTWLLDGLEAQVAKRSG